MSSVQSGRAVVALHHQENCDEETSDVHFVWRLPLACKQPGGGQYPSVSAPTHQRLCLARLSLSWQQHNIVIFAQQSGNVGYVAAGTERQALR